MARTLSIVQHPVSDYDKWHRVYEEVQPLRDKHGVTAANVLQDPSDPNAVTVLHWFPSLGQAQSFAGDPELKDAMARAGVSAPPRVEIVVEAQALPARRPPEAAAFEHEYPGARWLASRCVRELEVVGGLVEGAITSVPSRFGLSHAALNALAVIEGEGRPMLTGEVGARMHITSGSVTALLDTLERKGYIGRTSDVGDRRRVLVDVTPSAQAVLDEMLPAVQQICRHLVDRLGPQRQQVLVDILGEIRGAIADLPTDLPDAQPRRRPDGLTRR